MGRLKRMGFVKKKVKMRLTKKLNAKGLGKYLGMGMAKLIKKQKMTVKQKKRGLGRLILKYLNLGKLKQMGNGILKQKGMVKG